MSLLLTIKDSLKKAMFEKDEVKKNILRVAIGEAEQLQMSSQQGNRPVSDEQVAKILNKLMQSNLEVLENTPVGDRRQMLETENLIINLFLPKQLSRDEIRAKLEQIGPFDKTSLGKLMGVAMKTFKDAGDFVDGNDVKAVLQELVNAQEANNAV